MNCNMIQKTILNKLVDKYEKSKSFIGANVVRQKFALQPSDLFPKYNDDLEYDIFVNVNDSVEELAEKKFVFCKKQKGSAITLVELNCDKLDDIYSFLKRKAKKNKNEEIEKVLEKYKDVNAVLSSFCSEQLERLAQNKNVRYCDDICEFEQILKAVAKVIDVKEETYIREVSIKIFGDSKVLERIEPKVVKILCDYGGFPEDKKLFQNLNIVRNPGYIHFRGNGKITISSKEVDVSAFEGGLGLSSKDLKNIERIVVDEKRIVTIENLTTFNFYKDNNSFVVYTGGFCSEAKRRFLEIVYLHNGEKEYFHWGDIDAGGFYIFNHLKDGTGIKFNPLYMDKQYLSIYKEYCKPLTTNDKKRLNNLTNSEFAETIKYMLENNCKLEQEALSIAL